ncbi:MFS transporter [Thalassiella azotivora]
MSLAPYRRLLGVPSVRNLLLVGILARLPHTTAGVVLTLHVVYGLERSWTEAGLVATAVTVGMAVGAPWRGRVVDRYGLRRALAPSIVVEALVWSAAPFVPYHALLVVGLVGGVMGLPIFTVIRQSLSILVPLEQRRSAYAVDSMGVELSFMAGPAAGVVVATQWSTTAALLLVGGTTVAAGLGLAWFNPPTRSEQLAGRRVGPSVDAAEASAVLGPAAGADAERAALEQAAAAGPRGVGEVPAAASAAAELDGSARRTRWSRSPSVLAVLAAAGGGTLVLAGTDVGVVAVLDDAGSPQLLGLVFAAWGVGSIVGGLVYGQARRAVHPLWLLLGLAVLTVPVGLATSPWLLALAILPAGALVAPVISSTAEAVARLVPEESRGTAMGWHGSAMTVGSALGAPVAGAAIDGVAPWAAFAVVGVVGLGVAATGLSVQRARRAGAAVVGGASPA